MCLGGLGVVGGVGWIYGYIYIYMCSFWPKASKFVPQCLCLAGATLFKCSCKCARHIQANVFLNVFAQGRKVKRRRRGGCVFRRFRGCRGNRVDTWSYM